MLIPRKLERISRTACELSSAFLVAVKPRLLPFLYSGEGLLRVTQLVPFGTTMI